MLFLFALAITLITAFLLDKPLKKSPSAFYLSAAVLTVVSVAIKQADVTVSNEFVREYLLAMFTRGALGAAFWAVVMWAGALPNGSAPIKRLMPIRGELSITAAILTLSHVVTYGIQYISDIIRDRTGSGDALRDFVITSAVCLIMVLIMLPLTVMSFKTVRKKMNGRSWKKAQRFAYLFYALIFIHILVLFVPKAQKGREGYLLSVLVYSAVFIGYAAMRIRKAYVAKRKPLRRTAPNIVCACAMIVPMCVIGFISRNTSEKETIKATREAPATFVFDSPAITKSSVTTAVTSIAATVPETTVNAPETAEITSAETPSLSSEQPEASAPETTSVNETTETVSAETKTSAAVTETTTTTSTAPVKTTTVTTTVPEPVYRFKNGTFEGTGEGYSGTVHVSITIENDYITAFSAYADEDDPDYFSDAMQHVIPQIQRNMNTDVDAFSGATYSSKGIIEASRDALKKAEN